MLWLSRTQPPKIFCIDQLHCSPVKYTWLVTGSIFWIIRWMLSVLRVLLIGPKHFQRFHEWILMSLPFAIYLLEDVGGLFSLHLKPLTSFAAGLKRSLSDCQWTLPHTLIFQSSLDVDKTTKTLSITLLCIGHVNFKLLPQDWKHTNVYNVIVCSSITVFPHWPQGTWLSIMHKGRSITT